MITIENPILPGFNPDPSILRVGSDYYIAVSSFEWLPGIRIYHSTNLAEWTHCTDLLVDQIDLRGNAQDCSIWAPQISYDQGTFYCVFTNVRNTTRPFKDCRNYLMTASSIKGPWRNPVYLNSSGFDPSLYHDQDGRKWLLNALWDYRKATPNKSAGIVMQEYKETEGLIGPRMQIFSGTALAKTEAPHLYRHQGYYYLLTAEGGTGSGHSVTVCRSRAITGPYEVDPENPMMSANDRQDSSFQCTGHGSLVQTPEGKWYMSYLMTRPVEGAAILGRETALQEVYWDVLGWLRVKNGDTIPDRYLQLPLEAHAQNEAQVFTDDFAQTLLPEWNGRRLVPQEQWCRLKERPGFLRLMAGESLQSHFDNHLLAIRQKDLCFEAETLLDYKPSHFNQMAGLVLFLNEENYLYLYVTYDETKGRVLRMMKNEKGHFTLFDTCVPLKDQPIQLKVVLEGSQGQFMWRQDQEWQRLPAQSILFLSGGFTGDFIGLCAQDLDQFSGSYADFAYFRYQGKC